MSESSAPSPRDLFFEALDQPAADRLAFVRHHCGDDETLRREVEALLAAHRAADDFLSAPALTQHQPTENPNEDAWLGSRIAGYELERHIGSGGMSRVYLARRAGVEFEQRAAIKLVSRGVHNQDVMRRFRTECRALARLQHPNIAGMIDGGITDDGIPYLVMEYVDGVRIDRYCDERGLSIRDRLELFRTVCAAVHYAHRHSIVHRDLKPSNVLVDREGHVKLLDFGIARIIDPGSEEGTEHTATSLRVLTPSYASPEQMRGQLLTTSTDVYSLGVVLYKLLTGQLPVTVDGTSPVALERVVSNTLPTKPSDVSRRATTAPTDRADRRRRARMLRGDLDFIVLMALRKEPERRYGSVEQFSEDVRRHLTGLPVIAKPETVGYLAAKFVRRHQAAVATAGAVGVLLVAFGVGMLVQANRVARERDRAQQISELMLDLFRSASPEVSRGDTITAVQVLDRGVDRVRMFLADQPAQLATLLGTMADAYEGLGQTAQATELARDALPLNVAAHGYEDESTVLSLVRLAGLMISSGHLDSALHYADRAEQIASRRFRRDEMHGRALMVRGGVLLRQGRRTEARNTLETAVEIFRSHADSASLPGVLVNLGWINVHEGRLDAAEALMRESLAIRRRRLDPNHPRLTYSLGGLASVLLRKGDAEGAEPLAAEALAIGERTYPLGHGNRVGLASLHAQVLRSKGDLDNAEAQYRAALSTTREVHGDRSEQAALMLDRLATFLAEYRGNARAAEPIFREAVSILAETRGPADPRTAVVEGSLATVLFAQGRLDEAVAILERTIPTLETTVGPEDTRLGYPLLNYGVLMIRLGRFQEAEAPLRRSLAIERQTVFPEAVRIARVHAGLGAALVGQARYAEAEPLLLEAHATLTESANPYDPYPRFTSEALVALYTRWGRPDEADRYRGSP